MKIGEKIKEQRLKKKWTQEQLAQLLNVSRSTVSSWEVGRNYPDLETIISISDLFGISLDNLLREDTQMVKETTKKIKRGEIYKTILVAIGVVLILFMGYGGKLKLDEYALRSNLKQQGWVQLSASEKSGASSVYGLSEEGIIYTGIISTSKWNSEKGIHVFTQKDEFMIEISYDDVIATSISPKNDSNISKNYYLELNQDGTTSDITTGLSKEEQQIIHEYLDQNKDVYADLIEKTLGKKLELSS